LKEEFRTRKVAQLDAHSKRLRWLKLALTETMCFKREMGSKLDTKLCGKAISFSAAHASTPSKLRKDRLERRRTVMCKKDPDCGDFDGDKLAGVAAMIASGVTVLNAGLAESLGGI
jgi:hypothetical protein